MDSFFVILPSKIFDMNVHQNIMVTYFINMEISVDGQMKCVFATYFPLCRKGLQKILMVWVFYFTNGYLVVHNAYTHYSLKFTNRINETEPLTSET